jgi:hypothetical protein
MQPRLLLASLLLFAACGSSNTIDATWSLRNDQAAATCPDGATTATIYARHNGATADDVQTYSDIFDCASGAGEATDIPDGTYHVWVELTDDSGATLYARSEEADLTLSGGDTTAADFTIDVANGFVDVAWQLQTAAGVATTCAETDQHGVSVLSTLAGTTDAVDSVFDCSEGELPGRVTSNALPIGDQVVSVALLDSNDDAIGAAPDVNATIEYGNQYVGLAAVTISLF